MDKAFCSVGHVESKVPRAKDARPQPGKEAACNDLEVSGDTRAPVKMMLEVGVCSGQELWDGEKTELCRAHAVEGCGRASTSAGDAKGEPEQEDRRGGGCSLPQLCWGTERKCSGQRMKDDLGQLHFSLWTSIHYPLATAFRTSLNISGLHFCL